MITNIGIEPRISAQYLSKNNLLKKNQETAIAKIKKKTVQIISLAVVGHCRHYSTLLYHILAK
ncbi:MAG: hypothetical protein V7K32_20550 [Nostoc sp.]|uniref:hypothetical protein n=1 Tax=Nostoc sp. TaxID=1180 RepID=UPI002FF92B45